MVTEPWEEPLLFCGGGFHSPAQTKSALRTVLDSHPSHGSQTQPVVDPGRQSQNATSFAPYFEMLFSCFTNPTTLFTERDFIYIPKSGFGFPFIL